MQSQLSSCASILLLGEANFSFSLSLKKMLPPSVTMVTSCYQSEDRILSSDAGVQENIARLQLLGVRVLYGVDATKLGECSSLEGAIYDAVIFNFPHVGGKGNIGRNRELLKQFFECCSDRLSPSGQVFLTLCNGQGGTPADKPQRKWNDSWKAVAMAAWGSFILTRTMPFCAEDYEDYYCTGYRSQAKHFVTQNAITHVFERSREPLDVEQLCPTPRELTLRTNQEMTTVQCPADLCRVIDRDLLSEPHHPLGLVSADLHRLINEGFADTTFLHAGEQPLVLNAGEVITTGRLSPSELYHVDVKRTQHIQQQDCCNRSIGVPQGAVLGTTTEPHEQPPLSPGNVKGLSSCTCAPRSALGSERVGKEMVIDSQSYKDSVSNKAERQDGLFYLEGNSKHGNTGTEQSSCQNTEDSESNGPHVTEITSAKVPRCPCLSKQGKSNYVLRPTLLSHIPGIFRKEDPQPLYACGRVFRRCGIRPEFYPILHQCLVVVPIPKDSETSSENFKEKVSRLSACLLQGKGLVSIEDSPNCQDGSINNHSSLVFKIEESNESSQSTLTIGECGIFHSEGGGYHYCIWNLDTIAMVQYNVEDIRLFWSADDRIVAKFSKSAEMSSESQQLSQHSLQGYSLHPPAYTYDLSFWLTKDTFDELDFYSAIRSVTFDYVREVFFLDQYINRKTSYLYRIVYQSCDRALTKKAATQLQLDIGKAINMWLDVESSCSDRLSPSGQVFLTLCNGQGGTPADKPQRKWNDSWKAVAMAAWGSFILTRTMPFCAEDYEDYYCTGYRSQAKHFVTQNAITHVFERSREPLDVEQPCPSPRELTLRTNQEMTTVQCPADLCRVIDRDLLSEPHHPLGLVSADLHRLINEGFADTTFLHAGEQPLVLNAGEVITTGRLSPSELYHVDVKRTQHIQQQDCCNRSIGVPQGAVLGTTTEPHEQPPLSPGNVKGLSSCTCAPRSALGSERVGKEMVIDSQSYKDSVSNKAERQDGLFYLEGKSKHGNTGTEQSSCQNTEDSESNGPHVTEITSAKVPRCPCLSKQGKSNYVLRPTLLSHIPGIFRKEDPQPLYACGRVFRRCGIRPEFYPILHQCLVVVPIPKDSETSSENFKEKVSRLSACLLQGKGLVSIEDSPNCQDGSINNHSSLVFKIEESNESSQSTLTIGECGIFHSEGGGYHYCIWNLDTIAMVQYNVEDIRLFWSADDRIVAKFSKSAEMSSESQQLSQHSLQGYSLHPPAYTYDLSFWLTKDTFDELDFYSAIRSVTFDYVREVFFLDQYINRKTSYLYRIVYQSCDRALTKKAATQLQLDIGKAINMWLDVESR